MKLFHFNSSMPPPPPGLHDDLLPSHSIAAVGPHRPGPDQAPAEAQPIVCRQQRLAPTQIELLELSHIPGVHERVLELQGSGEGGESRGLLAVQCACDCFIKINCSGGTIAFLCGHRHAAD